MTWKKSQISGFAIKPGCGPAVVTHKAPSNFSNAAVYHSISYTNHSIKPSTLQLKIKCVFENGCCSNETLRKKL